MRFIFATDTHATGKGPSSRTDSYPLAVKRKLLELAQTAKQQNAQAVIHGGDLFDKPVISLQLTGEIADIIRSSGVPWYVVPGNHDIFGYNIQSLPQTSLGLLARTGVVQILDRKSGPIEFAESNKTISFEGQEYHKDIDHRDPAMDYYVTSSADYKVLVPHSMLLDKEYFPDVPYTNTKDLKDNTEADYIFVGHYHDGYSAHDIVHSNKTKTRVMNPGSMLRDEASKGNLTRKPKYVTLEFINGNLVVQTHEFKVAQPGKDIFDRSHITEKQAKNKYLQSFEKKISDVNLSSVDVRDVLNEIVKKSPDIDQEISTEAHNRLTDAEQVVDDVAKQLSGYQEKPNNISIKEIQIKGFQSHEDTIIQLGNGLNAIIGPSDSGKSAIIRALRFAFYNEPRGSEFIRQSTQRATVKVTFDDGSSITRSRTRSSAGEYIITDSSGNQQELKGFTNNIPVDIPNTHQMPKIQLTKDIEAALNIGLQLEGPFLIGESASTRAHIIGQLTGVNLVDHALKELNSNVLSNNRDIKLKNESIEKINDKLKEFKDLPKLKETINKADKLIQKFELTQSRYDDLKDTEHHIQENNNHIQNTTNEYDNLKDAADIMSDIEHLELIQRELFNYESLNRDLDINTKSLNTAREEYDKIKPIADKQNQVQVLSDINDVLKDLQYIKQGFDNIDNEGINIANELENLENIDVEKVETLEHQVDQLNELSHLAFDLQHNRKQINQMRSNIRQAGLDEQDANIEFQKILSEAGTCPTCGQHIKGGHTHETHA